MISRIMTIWIISMQHIDGIINMRKKVIITHLYTIWSSTKVFRYMFQE